jgi:hypothetical protein
VTRLLLAAACAAALAGCAKRQAPPLASPAAPAAPEAAPTSLDGLYKGTSTRYQATGRVCPGPGLVTLRVQGGAFDYRWSNVVSLQVEIAPDRTLQLAGPGGPLGDISIAGRASPGLIEGDATSPSCAFHFTARRRG